MVKINAACCNDLKVIYFPRSPLTLSPLKIASLLLFAKPVMKDIGLSVIVCATIATMILIATFRPHTAGLHQAIVSFSGVGLQFVPPWLIVIVVSRTSLMVGGFQSKALSVF